MEPDGMPQAREPQNSALAPAKMIRARRKNGDEKCEDGVFEAYADVARAFRGWVVAYGVGAPVVFVSQNNILKVLNTAPDARWIMAAFFFGTFLQVGLSWLNKICNWWGYVGIEKNCMRFKFREWYTNRFWP